MIADKVSTVKLTDCLVIDVASPLLCAVHAKESFIHILLIPIEGEHPGTSFLGVATEEAGRCIHELAHRGSPPRLKKGGEDLQKVFGTVPGR